MWIVATSEQYEPACVSVVINVTYLWCIKHVGTQMFVLKVLRQSVCPNPSQAGMVITFIAWIWTWTDMQKLWIGLKAPDDTKYTSLCVLFLSFLQSTFVNRPALGILPPENFPDKISESLLSVSNTHIHYINLPVRILDSGNIMVVPIVVWLYMSFADLKCSGSVLQCVFPTVRWLPVEWVVFRRWPVALAPMRMLSSQCLSGIGWVSIQRVSMC